jgi:hypothetical protein
MADKAPPFPVDGRGRVALWAPLTVGDAIACFHFKPPLSYTGAEGNPAKEAEEKSHAIHRD